MKMSSGINIEEIVKEIRKRRLGDSDEKSLTKEEKRDRIPTDSEEIKKVVDEIKQRRLAKRKDEEEKWVTVNGTHVLIDEHGIAKSGGKLKGKSFQNAKSEQDKGNETAQIKSKLLSSIRNKEKCAETLRLCKVGTAITLSRPDGTTFKYTKIENGVWRSQYHWNGKEYDSPLSEQSVADNISRADPKSIDVHGAKSLPDIPKKKTEKTESLKAPESDSPLKTKGNGVKLSGKEHEEIRSALDRLPENSVIRIKGKLYDTFYRKTEGGSYARYMPEADLDASAPPKEEKYINALIRHESDVVAFPPEQWERRSDLKYSPSVNPNDIRESFSFDPNSSKDLIDQVREAQGFDRKPKKAKNRAEFEQAAAASGTVIYRTCQTDTWIKKLCNDDEYTVGGSSGLSNYGYGIYFTMNPTREKGQAPNEKESRWAYENSHGGYGEHTVKATIASNARFITYQEADSQRNVDDKGIWKYGGVGEWAAASGYDGIIVPGAGAVADDGTRCDFLVLLNRSIMIFE